MQPKSKLAAGLFGIFLGCFGVHNFYMGYTAKAVIQLVLSVVAIATAGLIVIPYVGWAIYAFALACVFASRIWSLIEGIQILAKRDYYDARGVRLEWTPQ